MPITLKWMDTGKTMLLWTIDGEFAPDDVVAAAQRHTEIVRDLDHAHCIILDLSTAAGYGASIISRYPEIASKMPPPNNRAKVVAAVGSSFLLEKVTGIFGSVYNLKFQYFRNREEAISFIHDHLDGTTEVA